MTVSDTHADTIRDADAAVALRCALMSSLAVTGPLYTHETYDEGMAALDALVAERDSLALELEAERHNHRKDNEHLVAERDRERARADRAEAALAAIDRGLTTLHGDNVVRGDAIKLAVRDRARAALSAGSGGREDRPPPPRPPVIKPPSVEVIGPPAPWQRARKRGRGAA